MIVHPPRSTRPDTRVPYTTRVRSRRGDAGIAEPGLARVAAGPLAQSPDLRARCEGGLADAEAARLGDPHPRLAAARRRIRRQLHVSPGAGRSEEHKSELQSLMRISYAVFCLKKKKKKNYNTH